MQLMLSLEAGSTGPLYKQMANAICKAIESGALRRGQVMPSTRELAECMSVSRLTARRCYEELIGMGYIKTQSRGKTFVSNSISPLPAPTPLSVDSKKIEFSPFGKRILSYKNELSEPKPEPFAITPHSLLPIARWQESLYEAVRDVGTEQSLFESDPFGFLPLREQLQALLSRTRGIVCSPEQIVILPSTEGGLDLLSRLILSDGDLVATEDPSFIGIRQSLKTSGATVCPIALDRDGIRIDLLAELPQAPRLIYVTPSHQDTLGIPMSRSRRHRLLQWVVSNNTIIVEDDYDSEYRYGEEPLPALFSQDLSGSVVYKYNFWKSLYPLVKLSFMVIPAALIPSFRQTLSAIRPEMPLLEQVALANFIRKGHYERHLHRSRKAYACKRASLIHALTKVSGNKVKFSHQTGGTSLLAHFPARLSESAIEAAAKQAGITMLATRENYAVSESPKNEYLISFSDIDEDKIDLQISQFMQSLHAEDYAMPLPAFVSEQMWQKSS